MFDWDQAMHQTNSCLRQITTLQGTTDNTVSGKQNLRCLNKVFANNTTIHIENGKHELFKASMATYPQVCDHLLQILASSP